MTIHVSLGVDYKTPLFFRYFSPEVPHRLEFPSQLHIRCKLRRVTVSSTNNSGINRDDSGEYVSHGRRSVILAPFLAVGASFIRSAVVRAGEMYPKPPASAPTENTVPAVAEKVEPSVEKAEEVSASIYDAMTIGEPVAVAPVGKDRSKVWEKVMNARVVYLGEAEQVPTRDDKELELEIVRNLRRRCLESERSVSVALEAFPCDLQEQLNQFMDGRS